MINSIKLTTAGSPSIMMVTDFHVVHTNFEVDVEMICFFVRSDGRKWVLDDIDYGGVSNLTIDGVVFSAEDTNQYLDFLIKVGIDYRRQIIEAAENMIDEFSDEEIENLINGRPRESSEVKMVTAEDVIKVSETIECFIKTDEIDEVVNRSNKWFREMPKAFENKSLVIENYIYSVRNERINI